jgi:hypothetical protein
MERFHLLASPSYQLEIKHSQSLIVYVSHMRRGVLVDKSHVFQDSDGKEASSICILTIPVLLILRKLRILLSIQAIEWV